MYSTQVFDSPNLPLQGAGSHKSDGIEVRELRDKICKVIIFLGNFPESMATTRSTFMCGCVQNSNGVEEVVAAGGEGNVKNDVSSEKDSSLLI